MTNVVIPYGVVETDKDGKIVDMKEKPDFSFMVNTGVYMIEPEVLDYIEDDEQEIENEIEDEEIEENNESDEE